MMDLKTEAKDGEDRTLLVPDEFDTVDTGTSDAESPSSPWLLKPRSLACMAGLALLGAVLFAGASHQSAAVPQKSNVEKTIELGMVVPTSTFYLIKHTFQSKDSIDSFWKYANGLASDPDKMKKFVADGSAAGFHNHVFLPTAREGPMFCLWEAQPGKDISDVQKYIDAWTSSFTKLTNNVMLIPSKLTGFPPINVQPFFGGHVARRLKSNGNHTSKLYLIQHTFKDKAVNGSFWKKLSAQLSDQDKWKQMVADSAAAGFYDQLFLPTAPEGPMFCLWEAQPVKNTADMQRFINVWTSHWTNFTNVVMPIALELVGGFPKALKPFF